MGGGDCFIAGTKVTMSDDSTKNIEDIVIGDDVLTFDIDKGELVGKKVNGLMTQVHTGDGEDYTIKIKFNGKFENHNTHTHPYLIKDKGWASYSPELTEKKYDLSGIKQLELGDMAVLYSDEKILQAHITNIEEVYDEVITYNLMDIEDVHNFFANGILVHNKGGDSGAGMADGNAAADSPVGGGAMGGAGETGGIAGGGGGLADMADMGIAVDMGSSAATGAAPAGSFGGGAAPAPADAPGTGSITDAQANLDSVEAGSFGFNTSLFATVTPLATALTGNPIAGTIAGIGAGIIGGSDPGLGDGSDGPGEGDGPGDYTPRTTTPDPLPTPITEDPVTEVPPEVPPEGGTPGDIVNNPIEEYLQELSARRDQRFGFADTMQFQDDGSPTVFVESAWGASGAGELDIEAEDDVEMIFG
ncbi:MAG: hypothetical protein DRJ03_18225 [Chloroflexi bacterium]|nr:MAG: hypothetical protein DRJ03_18225 [Chloroflexota bacterium]